MLRTEIEKALAVLKNGGVILYPTDTVWGLGCDATNEQAVAKINEIKGRAADKSFIILLDTDAKLQSYVTEIPDVAYDLIEYAENPLTTRLFRRKEPGKKCNQCRWKYRYKCGETRLLSATFPKISQTHHFNLSEYIRCSNSNVF